MNRRMDKIQASKYGIPKSLQAYAKRYGSSVEEIIRVRLQCGEGKRVGERRDKEAA